MKVAEQELGVIHALVERIVQFFQLLCEVDRPRHGSHEVRARNGAFVFSDALPRRLEEDGDEVVGEDAGLPEYARHGAVVVGVVLAPVLLEVLQAAVALVAHAVHALLVASERVDDAPDGRVQDGSPIDVRLVAGFIF